MLLLKKVTIVLLCAALISGGLGTGSLILAKSGFGISTEEGMLSLIETIAGFEEQVIQKSVQFMRIEEGLLDVPSVDIPTNDMASFPSAEHPLYPYYVARRYSRFKYTINSYGTVTVHAEGEAHQLLAWIDRVLQLLQGG